MVPLARLVPDAPTAAPSNPFASFSYGRDGNGQVSSVASTGVPADNHSYGYTSLNQLQAVDTSSYGYSAADTITQLTNSTALSYDAADEVTSSGQPTVTVVGSASGGDTGSGKSLTITLPAGIQANDQILVASTQQSGKSVTTRPTASPPTAARRPTSTTARGQRTAKTVSGTAHSFTWDSAASLPLLLVDSTSASTTYFVYGEGAEPIEQISSSGAVYYLHQDQLGSTRVLTDATGAVAATLTYDAYGNLTGSTGTATTPLQYAGEYRDAESGLYYLRARYYDPTTAQFLTRDPAGSLTRDPYGYSSDDPLNATDPTGLIAACDPPMDSGCLPGNRRCRVSSRSAAVSSP